VRSVNIGICGLGTVGAGVFNVLGRNTNIINSRANCEIAVTQVGARRDNPSCDTSGVAVVRDIFEVAKNPAVDVVVELIGGTTVALELVMTALRHDKHVVSAN
jgi:homoserine dehydrogenase